MFSIAPGGMGILPMNHGQDAHATSPRPFLLRFARILSVRVSESLRRKKLRRLHNALLRPRVEKVSRRHAHV